MKKSLLVILSLIIVLIMGACDVEEKNNNSGKTTVSETDSQGEVTTKSNEDDTENNTEISTENTTEDTSIDDPSLEGIEDTKVEFDSFLVERCARKALGKGWDEDITERELATIKELVIQEVYNPALVADFERAYQVDDPETGGRKNVFSSDVYNLTYIDLADLKYFVNLENLKIDNISTDSMITNVEAITNCKELKQLSVLYNFSGESSKNFGGVGYLYWAGIIGELPKLEVVDFGTYLDAQAQKVLMSKSQNQNIQFVQYDMDSVGRLYWRHIEAVNYINKIDDATIYNSVWNYEYRGIEKTSQLIFKNDAQGVFPYIEVNSVEELNSKVALLDKDIEDIIIKLDYTVENVDFSIFTRFEKLVTLTLINTTTSRVVIETWNDAEGHYTYDFTEYVMPTIVNSSALAANKNLKTISLIGLDGDFTGIAEVSGLRELYLTECIVESCDYSKLEKLNSFVYTFSGLSDDLLNLKNLNNLRMFMTDIEEISDIVDGMSGLETLILDRGGYGVEWSELNAPNLSNLLLDYSDAKTILIDDEFLNRLKGLTNLEVLKVNTSTDDGMMIHLPDTTILLEMENLYSIVIPCCNVFGQTHEGTYSKREYVSASLAEKVRNKANLSQFVIERYVVGRKIMDNSYLSNVYDLRVYEAGIYSGFVNKYILGRQIGGGASSVDACIERVLDSLLVSDEEMFKDCLYKNVYEKYKTSYGMSQMDIFVKFQKCLDYSKLGFKSFIVDECVYRNYIITEYKQYTRQEIEDKFRKDNVEVIQEVVEVELNIPRWEIWNMNLNPSGEVMILVKVDGLYYLYDMHN